MEASIDIAIVKGNKLTAKQKVEMLQLQRDCFLDVTAEEVEEDFCRPPVASVLAYSGGKLVACAEVFLREVAYEGCIITVGGFSPCATEGLRGKGIGTAMCHMAMGYLKER